MSIFWSGLKARSSATSSTLLINVILSFAGVAVANAESCPEPAVSINATEATPLTEENYPTAETQSLFAGAYVKKIAKDTCSTGMGVIMHERVTSDPEFKDFARVNYDTLYSWALLDLTSPATITLPETDGRYLSAHVLNEGHWMPFVITEPGSFELTEENSGSRYVLVGFRTQMNMQDPDDIKKANETQDQITLEQAEQGELVFDDLWDQDAILAMRKDYQKIHSEKGYLSEELFGKQGEIEPELNNIGVAIGWGGLPKEGAVYLFYTAESEEHQTLSLEDVPIGDNAFWSITVYDADGFIASEPFNVNSSFSKNTDDGNTIINFGGDPAADNYLPIFPGWNATLRIYAPQEAYFDESWSRAELQMAK